MHQVAVDLAAVMDEPVLALIRDDERHCHSHRHPVPPGNVGVVDLTKYLKSRQDCSLMSWSINSWSWPLQGSIAASDVALTVPRPKLMDVRTGLASNCGAPVLHPATVGHAGSKGLRTLRAPEVQTAQEQTAENCAFHLLSL